MNFIQENSQFIPCAAISLLILFELFVSCVFFVRGLLFNKISAKASAKIQSINSLGRENEAFLSFKDDIGNTVNTSLKFNKLSLKENDEINILYCKNKPEFVKMQSIHRLWSILIPAVLFQGSIGMTIALIFLAYSGYIACPSF